MRQRRRDDLNFECRRPLSRRALLFMTLVWGTVGGLGLGAEAATESPFAILKNGQIVAAHLREISDNGDWIFSRAGQTVALSSHQLVTWGILCEQTNRSCILLRDGSLIVADLLEIDKDEMVVISSLWSEIRLVRSQVSAIILRTPLEDAARDALVTRALRELREQDVLLLEHGDELRGRVPDSVEPEPGAFHPGSIRWPVGGTPEPIDVSLDRVTAILFAAGNTAPSGGDNTQWVGLRDGSRLRVKSVMPRGTSLTFNLSIGPSLVLDETGVSGGNVRDAIVYFQPLGDGVAYLSDLTPLGYRHLPYLSSSWPYYVDHNARGGFLRIGDHLVVKGVGMHSSSRLAYDRPGQYHTLQAELAIDQCAGRNGSVIFRVYVQSKAGQWDKAFESDVVRGGETPVPMRVDLRDATRFALIVDFADRADQGDHANWLNARLVR